MNTRHRRALTCGAGVVITAVLATSGTVAIAAAPAAAAPTGTVYVSDLEWFGESNGYGPIERDTSNGQEAAGDGLPLTLGGTTYSKGVGMHATGELSVSLEANCSRFSSVVGIDDSVKTHPTEPGIGSVSFEVWGDGALLAQTQTITGDDAPETLAADVSGVRTLRLVAAEATNGKNFDHADWADAKLECQDTQPEQPAIVDTWELTGPDDSELAGELQVDDEGQLRLDVVRNGQQVIAAEHLGLHGSDGDLRAGVTFVERADRVFTDSYTMVSGKAQERSATFAESIFTFTDDEGTQFDLNIRLSEDGAAYRYEIAGDGERRVDDESGEWVLPSDGAAWMQQSYAYNYEAEWATTTAAAANGTSMVPYPALFEQGESFVLLTESNLHGNYSASHLSHETGSLRYGIDLFEGEPVSSTGDLTTPWRVAIIGGLDDVVESTLVDDLATPSQVQDTSWIKPGVSSWSWLTDWDSPRDEARQRDFIDLSAQNGWEYVLLDEGWDASWVPRTIRYAKSKGVDTIVWFHSRDLRTQEQRDRWLPMLKSWGVSGIKVDFMDTDSQEIHQWYDAIAADTAKYELMINFHGSALPTGLQRTWPQIMSYEAVRGAENGIVSSRSLTVPFVRGVVGSMDWTPGVFSKGNENSSKAHEVAMSIVYETGWTHYADKPETYAAEPDAQTFMQNVPASWADTQLLGGWPGESIVLARKSGDDWLVGGMRSGSGEALELPLGNLGFEGDVIVDLLSDQDGDGSHTVLTSEVHTSDDVINVPTATNGGFAARVCAADGRTTCLESVERVPNAAMTITPSTADVKAGETVSVTAELAIEDAATTSVEFAPVVPEGWTIDGGSATAETLEAGAPLTATWQITAPSSGVSGVVEVPFEGTYVADGEKHWIGSQTTLTVLPPVEPGEQFISDMIWLNESNGYGPIERDQSNGEHQAEDGRPIEIGGVTYPKGVGMHATGELTVWLGQSCTTFSSIVGIDDEVLENLEGAATGSVRFQVWGDDELLAETDVLRNSDGGVALEADVRGVSKLRLVADEGTDGKNHDHADWAMASVSCEQGSDSQEIEFHTSPGEPDGQNGWFVTPVEVSVEISEAPAVHAVAAGIEVSLDGESWQPYDAPLAITADGVTTVSARLADGSGEVSTSTIRLDTTVPVVEIEGIGDGGAPVSDVTWSATAPSGIAAYTATLDGEPVTGQRLSAKDLGVGEHQLTVAAVSTAGAQSETVVADLVIVAPGQGGDSSTLATTGSIAPIAAGVIAMIMLGAGAMLWRRSRSVS